MEAIFDGKSFEEMKPENLRLAAQIFYEESAALRVSHVVDDEGDLAVPVWRIKLNYSDESA